MPLDELKKYYVAPEEKESSSDEINQARARLEKLNAMRRRPVFENQDAANAIQEQSKGGLINMGNDLSISAIGGGIGNALGNTPGAILGSLAARPMVDMFTGAREKGNVPEGQPHYDPKIHSVNVPGMNMDVGRPAFYVNESLRPIANAVVDAGAKGVDMIKSAVGNPMFHADFP